MSLAINVRRRIARERVQERVPTSRNGIGQSHRNLRLLRRDAVYTPVYVRNAHFRQLANSCWALETTKEIDGVYRFVDEMPWYYVCEYPEMSIAWLRRAFDWNLGHLPRENVTRIQSDQAADLATLDDRIWNVILAKNDLDFALYRYAVDRFLSRVTAHPIELRNIIQQRARSVVQPPAERRSVSHGL